VNDSFIPNPDPKRYAMTMHGYKPLPKFCPKCKRPFMPVNPDAVICPSCNAGHKIVEDIRIPKRNYKHTLKINGENFHV